MPTKRVSHSRTLPPLPSDAKSIDGFDGYAVTRCGGVLNCRLSGGGQPRFRSEWVPMKQYRRPVYLSVTLWRNNRPSHIYVHKLVLTAFAGPRPVGHEACHIDGSKTNNRIENLSWAKHEVNESQKQAHGTAPKGTKNARAVLTDDIVRAIRLADGTQKSIAERFGVAQPTVCNVRKRKTWKHVA